MTQHRQKIRRNCTFNKFLVRFGTFSVLVSFSKCFQMLSLYKALFIRSESDSLYTHSKLNLIHPAISDNSWSSDTKSLKLSQQSLLNSMIHYSYLTDHKMFKMTPLLKKTVRKLFALSQKWRKWFETRHFYRPLICFK